MASMDLDKMLKKVKNTQWTLSDIVWDASGRERVTSEQWPKLKDFMADLMWIEHVGARAIDPRMLLGILAYLPLINNMRDNVIKLGLPEEKLYAAMNKFSRNGGRTVEGLRNPWFQIIQFDGKNVVDRNKKWFHMPIDAMVKVTNQILEKSLPRVPTWIYELTAEPKAIN